MTGPLRIINTGLQPARWNVAMTATLAELHAKLCIPDTVRFHRYSDCVLIGRTQAAERVADLAYCRRAGIEIARRVTGGGAVFMSPQILAWDVVIGRRSLGSFDEITHVVSVGIAAGLSLLGASAAFRAPNAIEIGGRKVSGSSGYADANTAVLQGTVIVSGDIPAMARALRIPASTLRNQVTSLVEACADPPPLDGIIAGVTRGLAEALARDAVMEPVRLQEIARCDTLLRAGTGAQEVVSESAIGAEHERQTIDCSSQYRSQKSRGTGRTALPRKRRRGDGL
ncbi:MAG: biotin/lipoate A/B protein ligase family protein [Hyphomicrobiaceae bacterium]